MVLAYSEEKSIYRKLVQYAEKNPDRVLFADENVKYTGSAVLKKINRLACGLFKIGIRENTKVILRVENNATSSMMLLSLLAIGANIYVVNNKTTVIDYFNEPQFDDGYLYITNENNVSWIAVSQTDADSEIVEEDGNFREAENIDAVALVLDNDYSCCSCKQIKISQKEVTGCIGVLQKNDFWRGFNSCLCILPPSDVYGLLFIVGSIFSGYSVTFPKISGYRHYLHCANMYALSAVLLSINDVVGFTEFAKEYDLSSVKNIIVANGNTKENSYLELEEKIGISIVSV